MPVIPYVLRQDAPFGKPCLLRLLAAGPWCRQAVPTSPPGVAVRERPEGRPVLFFEEALTKSTEETSRELEASRIMPTEPSRKPEASRRARPS